MPLIRSTLPILGAAAAGFTLGASGLAVADFGMSGPGSQLGMPQYMRAESKAVAELGDHEVSMSTSPTSSFTWASLRPPRAQTR